MKVCIVQARNTAEFAPTQGTYRTRSCVSVCLSLSFTRYTSTVQCCTRTVRVSNTILVEDARCIRYCAAVFKNHDDDDDDDGNR
mmetsp:Transcript_24388/g.53399  ORF Transcript_24388/g.53399 Transcript_24388/m.53399 type:complete len:84 (+) Transcript_24388:141-392(+)